MIQTRPYEFMVKYTPQRRWIEGSGILFWPSLFFTQLGAGVFFASSFFDHLWGLITGWLICALLGGGIHLIHLGHPLRAWRMCFSSGWKTSWISRGLYFVILFLISGAVHICLLLWATSATPLIIIADILAVLVIIYGGFTMNYINGIALWNTPLLPILYLVSGIWGGAGLTLVSALATNTVPTVIATGQWMRILLMGFFLLLIVYLISVRYGSPAGEVSVRQIIKGKWASLFWIVVVLLGMAVPTGVIVTSFLVGLEAIPAVLLYVAISSGLLGDVTIRYLILRTGYYHPLVPSHIYAY